MPLGIDSTEGEMRAFVNYNKNGGKHMFFLSFIIYMSCQDLKNSEAPNSNAFLLSFYIPLPNISSIDSVWKISHCDVREAVVCVVSPALETAGSVKCTTAQSHISFGCQFVRCAAHSFELHLKMKANLVHNVSPLLLICFRRHQGLGDYFPPFYSSELCWIGHYV